VQNQPLVIFHKQPGDLVLLEPALSKIATATQGKVHLATRKPFEPLVALMPQVSYLSAPFFHRASSVISLSPRPRAGLIALSTFSAKKYLVVPKETEISAWHRLVYFSGCTVASNTDCYRAKYFFDVVPYEIEAPFRPPQLVQPPVSWRPKQLPSEYILVHATSAWRQKSWPAEHWARVLDALCGMGLGPFVLTGGPSPWEREFVAQLESKTNAPVLNLSGQTSFCGYLSAVANAKMVLCIDGSATHLAAAFGRPNLTLFGPTHPLHWHYPQPSSVLIDARSYIDERKPCVSNIPIEPVIEAASQLWRSH